DQRTIGAAPGGVALTQTAPGRYEAWIASPRGSRLAEIKSEGDVIARIELAGRYAPEFDSLGNDHKAMAELARRSSGRVVSPAELRRLDIKWPLAQIALAGPLAFSGV